MLKTDAWTCCHWKTGAWASRARGIRFGRFLVIRIDNRGLWTLGFRVIVMLGDRVIVMLGFACFVRGLGTTSALESLGRQGPSGSAPEGVGSALLDEGGLVGQLKEGLMPSRSMGPLKRGLLVEVSSM